MLTCNLVYVIVVYVLVTMAVFLSFCNASQSSVNNPISAQAYVRNNGFVSASYAFSAVTVMNIMKAPGAQAASRPPPRDVDWYNPRNERIFDTKRNSFLPTIAVAKLIEDELNVKNQRVVVIGEIHSNPCHHRVEFDVIRAFFDAEDKATLKDIAINNVQSIVPPVNNYAIGK